MLTVANLYNDVYNKTGLTTTDVSSAVVLTFLNERYNDLTQIITEVNEDFLATSTTTTMTSGSRLFAMPSDTIKIKRVEVAYDGSTWRTAEYLDLNATGLPTDNTTIKAHFSVAEPKYDIWGTNIDLLPPATALATNSFKLYYIAQPAALAAVTDTPNIALQGFEHLLSEGAIVDVANRLGMQTIVAAYAPKWEQGKIDLRRQLQNRSLGEDLGFTSINENRE